MNLGKHSVELMLRERHFTVPSDCKQRNLWEKRLKELILFQRVPTLLAPFVMGKIFLVELKWINI